jgi:hypothetical protein
MNIKMIGVTAEPFIALNVPAHKKCFLASKGSGSLLKGLVRCTPLELQQIGNEGPRREFKARDRRSPLTKRRRNVADSQRSPDPLFKNKRSRR